MSKGKKKISSPPNATNATHQTSGESITLDFTNQCFDSYTGDQTSICSPNKRPLRPSLPPLPKKCSQSENMTNNKLSLTVLPSITQGGNDENHTCEMFLLTLAVSVEASLPPLFYERLLDVMSNKSNVKLPTHLLTTARTLLFEDDEQWNQLRDDEMINLIQLWKNKQ
jgi:hypothetical protein